MRHPLRHLVIHIMLCYASSAASRAHIWHGHIITVQARGATDESRGRMRRECSSRWKLLVFVILTAQTHTHTHTYTHRHTHTDTHTHRHTHRHSDSDMPIAEAMIANSYVRHSNLCWDCTIPQLARLMN